jgi:GT2 family glycosyltransferase
MPLPKMPAEPEREPAMRAARGTAEGPGHPVLRYALSVSRYLRPSARRTVARITERLFDAEWYAARQGLPNAEVARQHYVAIGAWVGLAPHPLVDPAWLCRGDSPRDLRRAPSPWTRSRAVLRFAASAPSEARDPHPLFDAAWYQAAALVPEDSPIDVLSHFLLIGEPAGLSPHPLIDPAILRRELGCALLAAGPAADTVTDGSASPLTAYAAGELLDARTHELFDGEAYRAMHADVGSAGVVPLEHYVRSGLSEARATLAPVDEGWARVRWGVAEDAAFEPLGLNRRLSESALGEARRVLEDQLRKELAAFLRTPEEHGAESWSFASDPRVTVIVPVWNQAHATLRCLRALRDAAAHVPLRVHVIDNGSTDETDALLARFPGLTVTRWEENRGYGTAVNHGAASATTGLLLLLNNDAFVEPAAILHALQALDEEPDAGAVCARIVLPNGMLQEAGSYVLPDGSARGYLRGRPAADPGALHRRDVDFGSAAFLLVRRDVFAALEGFRPEFGLAYGEDVDLMLRMWDAGWRTVYEPHCVVHHLEGTSTAAHPEKVARMRAADELVRTLHGPTLEARAGQGAPDLFAHIRARQPRIVIIDDEVPDARAGAGQPRALAILEHLLQNEHAQVTLLPRQVVLDAAGRAHARTRARTVDPRIELHEGLPVDLWVDWLDANAGRIDVVWVSRSHNMIDLQRELARRGRTRLASTTVYDSEAIVAERDAALAAHLGQPWTRAELDAKREAELRCVDAADVIVSVAEYEADAYRSRTSKPVHVIGHRIDRFVERTTPPRTSRVLFVGRLLEEDSPNSLGLRWFLDEVWSRIAARSDAAFDIVGVAGPWLDPYRSERVLVHGPLDDLRTIYAAARVFVAPTFFAAGIPHKVHDAAAHGVPIVTTQLIATQVDLQAGVTAMVANAPATFAESVLTLLRDDEVSARYAAATTLLVRSQCGGRAFSGALRRTMESAIRYATSTDPEPPASLRARKFCL